MGRVRGGFQIGYASTEYLERVVIGDCIGFLSFVAAFLRVWEGGILGVGEVVEGWVCGMVRGLASMMDEFL